MMDIIQLSPAKRFKSLLTFASNVAIDHNVKAKFYYNSGLNMYKEFNIFYKEGNWENALSIYFKYNTLFFDKIKQHPDYGKVPVNIKSVIAANFRLIKPKAEHAKKELFKQYQMDYDCFVEEYNTNEYVSNENNSVSSSAKHHQVQLNMPILSCKKDHQDIISLAKFSAFEIKSQMSFNTTKQINDHLKLIKQAEDQQKAKRNGSNKSLTKSEIPPKKHTGSREAAFTYAISSAGVTFAITAACARGNISACGCQGQSRSREPAPDGWKWGGCSVDIDFGTRFARKFMDAREFEGDERSLMNLHNNKAGRKIVKLNLLLECKCHGVSGSCTMKTCWKTLPSFRQIGDALMEKYYRARPVAAVSQQPSPRNVHTRRLKKHQHLVLTKGKMPSKKPPKKAELVFLQMSPNYCERDLTSGSLGTVGRTCNRTSRGTDGCDLMCCGRGYNTHQYVKTTQCRCKFHWCCRVECDTCSEKTEEYSCK